MGTGVRGLTRGLAALVKGGQDRLEDPQVNLGRASPWNVILTSFSALTLLAGRQEGHPALKNAGCWYVNGDDLTGVLLQLSPAPPSLAPVKSRMVTFWYWLTEVVLENHH